MDSVDAGMRTDRHLQDRADEVLVLRRPARLAAFALGASLVVALTGHARAEVPSDAARAEQLFKEAGALVTEGHFARHAPSSRRVRASIRRSARNTTWPSATRDSAGSGVRGAIFARSTAWRAPRGKTGRAEAARTKMAELRARVPHLVLTVEDADASVSVDGEIHSVLSPLMAAGLALIGVVTLAVPHTAAWHFGLPVPCCWLLAVVRARLVLPGPPLVPCSGST